MSTEKKQDYTATKNACKLCTPLGASLAFKGIEGAVPMIHGSQGCSTYIRRYLISHFKEPIDIACSNFAEETAIFGGGANLKIGIENIRKQYTPDLVGVSTTCLSETIGDDVPMFLREYKEMFPDEELPPIVHVSTPSYQGTHIDGFHNAIRETVKSIVFSSCLLFRKPDPESRGEHVNILPGMVSPADMRHLKQILSDFGVPFVMLPDYSHTLDGPLWDEYQKIPKGGTTVKAISSMGNARASFEFGRILAREESAGKDMDKHFDIPCHSLGLPIGVNETDKFFDALESVTGRTIPEKYADQRGRLLDAYVDGHKYVSKARAVVYGEEDLVVGLASFLSEIGIIPIICASGGKSGQLEKRIREVISDMPEAEINILDDADFITIEEKARELEPDFFIGNSKGYTTARKLDVPLVRVGFPIHDRIGGSRILHLGYRGARELFDKIVNTIIEKRQETSSVGYTYI